MFCLKFGSSSVQGLNYFRKNVVYKGYLKHFKKIISLVYGILLRYSHYFLKISQTRGYLSNTDFFDTCYHCLLYYLIQKLKIASKLKGHIKNN